MYKQEKFIKDYTRALIYSQCIQIRGINETPFTLRNGSKSYIYVDHSKIASSTKTYQLIIEALRNLLMQTFKQQEFILVNVDSKISPQLTGTLAYLLKQSQFIFKSKALTAAEKGPFKQLSGDESTNLPVAIIDDVYTPGDDTAENVMALIKQQFPKVKQIELVVGLIRDLSKTSKTNTPPFPVHSLVSLSEVLKVIYPSLPPLQQQAVAKEMSI